MDHFPIFMTLQNQPVLVVGGGELAARKIRLLHKAQARLCVVAPSMCSELLDQADAGEITWVNRPVEKADIEGARLVFAATGLEDIDVKVASWARESGVTVNAVDRPAHSDFIMPAIIDRSPIVVAVSSGGSAPVLARNIRAQIESILPSRLGQLARFADRFRSAVKAMFHTDTEKRRFWEGFFKSPIAGLVLQGDEGKANEAMLAAVNNPAFGQSDAGKVTLVGAGPGDPDLLTLRALRALQEADLIVYDRLVDDRVLDMARRDAERLYVGKKEGQHTVHQTIINRVLGDAANRGRKVVRLKGGDPFIFGRGGEEMEFLEQRGVQVEVIPGITAAIGAGAAAGIPLTHRDHASAVTFVTGHSKDGGVEPDWNGLAASNQTLVFYMGLGNAGRISAKLMEAGLPADTPAAIVENATRIDQRTVKGSLAGLEAMVLANGIDAPSLIVVGDVAAYAKQQTAPAGLTAAFATGA